MSDVQPGTIVKLIFKQSLLLVDPQLVSDAYGKPTISIYSGQVVNDRDLMLVVSTCRRYSHRVQSEACLVLISTGLVGWITSEKIRYV